MRPNNSRIAVIVCDSCPMVFCGIQKSFESSAWIDIVAEVASLSALREKVGKSAARIALIDTQMVPLHDDEALRLLKTIGERVHILLYGQIESARDQKRALDAGVRGILGKHHSAQSIRRAILKVADGGLWLEAVAAESLLNHVFSVGPAGNDESRRIQAITPREHEVVELVCRGLRNKHIACELGISETTVCHHLTSIFCKLGVSDRLALVTFAFRHEMHMPLRQAGPVSGRVLPHLAALAHAQASVAC